MSAGLGRSVKYYVARSYNEWLFIFLPKLSSLYQVCNRIFSNGKCYPIVQLFAVAAVSTGRGRGSVFSETDCRTPKDVFWCLVIMCVKLVRVEGHCQCHVKACQTVTQLAVLRALAHRCRNLI